MGATAAGAAVFFVVCDVMTGDLAKDATDLAEAAAGVVVRTSWLVAARARARGLVVDVVGRSLTMRV